PDYLINHVSQSSQSFGWHDNARSYNSAHGWWLLPCHQIADIIPGVSEREYCNRAGNFDVEWAGRKRLWDVVRVNYRRVGLRFWLAWHDRISFIDATCAPMHFSGPTGKVGCSPGKALQCAGLYLWRLPKAQHLHQSPDFFAGREAHKGLC